MAALFQFLITPVIRLVFRLNPLYYNQSLFPCFVHRGHEELYIPLLFEGIGYVCSWSPGPSLAHTSLWGTLLRMGHEMPAEASGVLSKAEKFLHASYVLLFLLICPRCDPHISSQQCQCYCSLITWGTLQPQFLFCRTIIHPARSHFVIL